MKCPKCGFNSFEFMDACKKCGSSFESFKKTHRIRPVMFRPGSISAVSSGKDSPRENLTHAAGEPTGSPPLMETDEDFSWDAPKGDQVSGTKEEPFPEFAFQTMESAPGASADKDFTGFAVSDDTPADSTPSFTEEPVNRFSFPEEKDSEPAAFAWDTPPEPLATETESADLSPLPESAEENVFSFHEVTGSEPVPFSWDTTADASGPEQDDFERMLDPVSLGDTGTEAGDAASAGESGYFGTSEFSFTPEDSSDEILLNEEEPSLSSDFRFSAEQVTEDIFQSGEEVVVECSEKKTEVNLENFDEEFEKIFAEEDSDDQGKRS